MISKKAKFTSEAMLCKTFLQNLPKGWTAYPEVGYDILLVRDSDGAQIGIEAKLTLNAIVVCQAAESSMLAHHGPDFRAVLVPYGSVGGLSGICRLLNLTIIQVHDRSTYQERYRYWSKGYPVFDPVLPESTIGWRWADDTHWHDFAPLKRVPLPEYVPDVGAGHSAPVQLTDWKIRAIKIAILVERNGFVTKADFNHIRINSQRWLDGWSLWLVRSEERGKYVAGPAIGTFKKQHPVNYAQIEADFEKWAPKTEQA